MAAEAKQTRMEPARVLECIGPDGGFSPEIVVIGANGEHATHACNTARFLPVIFSL